MGSERSEADFDNKGACNTLQLIETHCDTLPHTETHCNTLRHTVISTIRTPALAAICSCRVLQSVAVCCSVSSGWGLRGQRPISTIRAPALAAIRSCRISQCVAVCCSVMQCVAVRWLPSGGGSTCGAFQHTTHYSTMQHTATHCNTLQHTATHCNGLRASLAVLASSYNPPYIAYRHTHKLTATLWRQIHQIHCAIFERHYTQIHMKLTATRWRQLQCSHPHTHSQQHFGARYVKLTVQFLSTIVHRFTLN